MAKTSKILCAGCGKEITVTFDNSYTGTCKNCTQEINIKSFNGEFMGNKMTGKEIAFTVEKMISTRAAIKIANELFRSRCDIKPAIEKLQKDIDYLNSEIEQNKAAINFLNRFVEN